MLKTVTSWQRLTSRSTRNIIAISKTMVEQDQALVAQVTGLNQKRKLSGRAFYESIGSPKMIVAPMVDRSEFAWRMLTRSYLDEERNKSVLAYTPMLHARLFRETEDFRNSHFRPTRESLATKEESTAKPWLDGNPKIDRPLFVQFCANKPDDLFEAAQYVAPYCDAVDLNLGCPQGIAKSGGYGAFLQEHWSTIHSMISKLAQDLPVPITAKIRILENKEKTLEYAKMVVSAGASILTVHGRQRHQKGHNMGVADWNMIRFLRDNLPPETVIFANGNILNSGDIEPCLEATGADGVMSAEGNLSDPTIFAKPPADLNDREYWRGPDGTGGYRLDGVFRRYLDIIYTHVLEKEPPVRAPLYITGDVLVESSTTKADTDHDEEPPAKKRKRDTATTHDPNLRVMQGHLFQLLKPMLSVHTDIRAALAQARMGNINAFEKILSMVEEATMKGLQAEANAQDQPISEQEQIQSATKGQGRSKSQSTVEKYARPYWVCQPFVRPLPEEAIEQGAMTVSKKEKARIEKAKEQEQSKLQTSTTAVEENNVGVRKTDVEPSKSGDQKLYGDQTEDAKELPKSALVCG